MDKVEQRQSSRRYYLSLIIIATALGILILLSVLIIQKGDPQNQVKPQTVFTAIIGLIGTWVGTILAFYFSKESFDAASKNTQTLIDKVVTGQQILQETVVTEAMIWFDDIAHVPIDVNNTQSFLLKNLLNDHLNKFYRLPFINADQKVWGITHRSVLDRFMTTAALNGENINELSLQDLLNSDIKTQVLTGFDTIGPKQSLADAKEAMEKASKNDIMCSDIFVTHDGTKNSRIIGWITNAVINENLKA